MNLTMPFAHFDPAFSIVAVFFLVGGPLGLCVTAKTLFLGLKKALGARCTAIAAATLTGSIMLATGALFCIVLGLTHAIEAMCIIGATDMLIMGTPLARFHLLTGLDKGVAERVAAGPKSWLDRS